MSLSFNLYQEQSQRLVMTVQMKQAIELLQCTTLELNQYVADWIDANPCADYEPIAHQLQDAWQTSMDAGKVVRMPRKGTSMTYAPLEQLVASEISLLERVDSQLRVIQAVPQVIHTARFLLGCLDESGYLIESLEDVCSCLGIAAPVFDEALQLLQACDPAGIGARNLAECLRLQLDFVEPNLRPLVRVLIDEHLKDVADGKLPVIAKKLRLRTSAIQTAVDALRKLNPRPGFACGLQSAEYVIPDVLVRKMGSDYVVVTNDHAQPQVHVNNNYRRLMRRNPDAEVRDYLQKKLHSAEWLIRCLEQRSVTLYRVAQAIVDHQVAFFDHGTSGMKPLTLRQIADKVSLHESTVSRATRGKYMLTPRGLFEMKYFFTAEVHSDDGVTSAQVAKHEIKAMVDLEQGKSPLSDEALTKQLSDNGIHISRRTVAKYREELKIPPSWRRRRYED